MSKSMIARRERAARSTVVSGDTIGNALVVHPTGAMTNQACALALGVAADPERDLVVLDLPVNAPIALWESVATVLPRRRRGMRLVLGGRSRETATLVGLWLAERLGRTVLVPDGPVIPGVGGSLFVQSGGWLRCQPGRDPTWEARRFPRPSWESALTSETRPTSQHGVAEPLPAGLWVRPTGFEEQQHQHRMSLMVTLPQQHDVLTIVLGCPGSPALPLADAANAWSQLPEPVQQQARFAQYGPVAAPAGTTVGQALADRLGREVSCYTGLPIGDPAAPEVRTVLFDGRLGWAPYARELTYRPGVPGGDQPEPLLRSHRVPLPGLTLATVDTGFHNLTFDAHDPEAATGQIEVEPRTPPTRGYRPVGPPPAFAASVDLVVRGVPQPAARTAGPLDPVTNGEPTQPTAEPTAQPTVIPTAQTDPPVGPALEVTAEVTAEKTVALARIEPETVAARPRTAARLQPTPDPAASALLPKRGVDQERGWLRKSLGQEYGLMSNGVARVLSQHPGFQGALSTSPTEVLTDAVAVQLYLSPQGAAIDAALRLGTLGPHVPIARCVVAGLSRLPSHRGPATFTLSPAATEWELYRKHTLLTEWGFLNALTTPSSFDGDTDVLVWSITARRTKLLEPPADGVEHRALFLPGTSFKVLELTQPQPDARGLVLLRELTASEVDESGQVNPHQVSLDELALTSLRRELEEWAEAESRTTLSAAAAARFGALPGLI